MPSHLNVRTTLAAGNRQYDIYSLELAERAGLGPVARLPVCLKVLCESLLRHHDERAVTMDQIRTLAGWTEHRRAGGEIAFFPSRVLLPDSSGIPLLADFAAMRETVVKLHGDPQRVNPLIPIDFVIDHSLMVDVAGRPNALRVNMAREMERNHERYAFLRWAQQAFERFRLVPPGNGILHQVNLEVLAKVVATIEDHGRTVAIPDTLVGMDSHTPMINAMAVLGWGVGGIEAAAAMLGQPLPLRIPEVVGCRMSGRPGPGVTTTDIVLTLTQRLRKHGVVGTFVEFCGPGIDTLTLPERATLANMAVEYGATTGFFPVDAETLRFLRLTDRPPELVELVEAYAKAQGMWRDATTPEPLFSSVVDFDLSAVEPSLAGPRRPQDRVPLAQVPMSFATAVPEAGVAPRSVEVARPLTHGDVVIAAITSCTNTSNPSVMVAAGLIARNAVARGLKPKPWVKASLGPGSRIVTDYLEQSGLQKYLDTLGFNTVGYGCTTCVGNSGPLDDALVREIDGKNLVVTAVLSGNRNFESRIHAKAKTNYLAAPPLVVAYALAGSVRIDLTREPLGLDPTGRAVYLRDIWPSDAEVREVIDRTITPKMFRDRYGKGFSGSAEWEELAYATGTFFEWDPNSEYLRRPPFFEGLTPTPPPLADIIGARCLVMLGDSVTTDHISPIGEIPADGPAGRYLIEHGVAPKDFNYFGSRRVNHEVMMRGTFANLQIRNEVAPGTQGGVTRHMPDGNVVSIYDAAMAYAAAGAPSVVIAGAEYGCGSSRDWAAKGTSLLGIRAVIAESFERIHRSNLVGMGVLPLEFMSGTTRKTLRLDGTERFTVTGVAALTPRSELRCTIERRDGTSECIPLLARIDTTVEAAWYRNGGVMNHVLRTLLPAATH